MYAVIVVNAIGDRKVWTRVKTVAEGRRYAEYAGIIAAGDSQGWATGEWRLDAIKWVD